MQRLLNKRLVIRQNPNQLRRVYFSQSRNWFKEQLRQDIMEFIYMARPEYKQFMKIGIYTLFTSAAMFAFPYSLKQLVQLSEKKYTKEENEDNKEQNKKLNREYIEFMLMWGSLYAIGGIFVYYRKYTSVDVGNRLAFRLRTKLMSVLMKQDYTYYVSNKLNTASLTHKLSNDISVVSYFLANDLFFGVRGIIFVVCGSLYLLLQIPKLVLVSLATMGAMSLVSIQIGKLVRNAKLKENDALTKTTEFANEKLSNMKIVKISHTENLEIMQYIQKLQTFYVESRNASKYTSMNYGFITGFGYISILSILGYAANQVSYGNLGAEIVAFSMYSLYVGTGFSNIIETYTELKKMAGLYEGIKNIVGSVQNDEIYNKEYEFGNTQKTHQMLLQEQQEQQQEYHQQNIISNQKESPPQIEFVNITYKYNEQIYQLKNFNLLINPGDVVALIGPSGVGKTTLLNLLVRLFDATSGQIKIDGQNINDIDLNELRSQIAYVIQEPVLFMGSIYDNIVYGNQQWNVSMDDVQKAVKQAKADVFINALPDGYNTLIGERGSTLSGGQRQRILIARALLRNPRILLFDEGTSSLDSHSEQHIINELKDICKGKTCIIVTHKIDNYKHIVNKIIEMKHITE